jgi:hypothetical protein
MTSFHPLRVPRGEGQPGGEGPATCPTMPSDTRAWTCSFIGADCLEGSFAGSWSHGSPGVDWRERSQLTRK